MWGRNFRWNRNKSTEVRMSLGRTARSGSCKSLAMDLEVECRKKLERQAQVRPEGPGRPNGMDFIHKSKISYQIILSSFRWMTLLVVRRVGLKSPERDHKWQMHPSPSSTNKNENKTCHLFDAIHLTNKPYKIWNKMTFSPLLHPKCHQNGQCLCHPHSQERSHRFLKCPHAQCRDSDTSGVLLVLSKEVNVSSSSHWRDHHDQVHSPPPRGCQTN